MFGRNSNNSKRGNNENQSKPRTSGHSPWRRWDESDRGTSNESADRFFGSDERHSSNQEYEDRGYNDENRAETGRQSQRAEPYGDRKTNYEYQRNPSTLSKGRSPMTADFQSEGVYQVPEGIGRGFREFQNPSSHFGKGPKGYKRSDDRIREEVCEALTHDHHIDASDIDVRVDSGTVVLSGTVDSRQTKRDVEECIERCHGVHDIQNGLAVKKAGWAGSSNSTNTNTGNSSSGESSSGQSGQLQ